MTCAMSLNSECEKDERKPLLIIKCFGYKLVGGGAHLQKLFLHTVTCFLHLFI